MATFKLFLCAVLIAFVAPVSGATFQIGYAWTFGELASKSDVVIVATPVRTSDSGTKTDITVLQGLPVVEMDTEFKLLLVLKGIVPDEFVLRHYRLDKENMKGACINCGTQLDFASADEPRAYLLFLKSNPDGRYEPTSGQLFPTHSVLLIQSTIPVR